MADLPGWLKGSGKRLPGRVVSSGGLVVLGVLLGLGGIPGTARAQSASDMVFGSQSSNPNAQMLLEADNVVYDNDTNTVSAVGNVQIAYDGYTLVAQRVTYSRSSGRVVASGNVEILEPNGSRIFAEEIDVTDDFRDGFVSSLRVETADNTRFAAESAERRDGEIAVFNHGVYTACEPCKEDPTKPPLWQIRANRVVINNRTRRVEYEGASFELYGKPIAYLPRFSHADPAVKRQSGFLTPTPSFSENLGFGMKNSYFLALAPNYDLTFSGTYLSNQGFLGEAEWRHRTETGQYNLRIAGINQKNPNDFKASTIDSHHTDRLAVMTTGQFNLNSRWKFGWNALWQSDEDFALTYNLNRFNGRDVTNEVYLIGLAGKNYFDLRAQQFLVQQDLFDQDPTTPGIQKLQDQQGNALPVLDYNRVSDYPVAGGEVSLDVNFRNIHRSESQIFNNDNAVTVPANERFHGIAGQNARLAMESEWKRSEIVNGAVVTASLSGRADAIWQNTDNLASVSNPLTSNDSLFRGMASGMLEIRYPMIAQDAYATHVFEPVAQIIVRPDETHIGEFPNEDAQSLVFDASNLFERDKFSGYDRIEGGTRANVGFRYSASYLNGATINVSGGQSYHLAGKNSFAAGGQDLVNAGLESGLETDRSDYVLGANINNGHGLTFGLGGRFDENNFSFRRGEAVARYATPIVALSGSYTFIGAQPNYGYADDRHEANGSASLKLTDTWRGFGSFSYDLAQSRLYSHGFGVAYDDSCYSFSVAYNRTEPRYSGDTTETSVLFRFGLRTIGDYDYKYSLEDSQ
ncbi:MAG: LPS-assembly protein LptD [Rhizobiaceae bacterium]